MKVLDYQLLKLLARLVIIVLLVPLRSTQQRFVMRVKDVQVVQLLLLNVLLELIKTQKELDTATLALPDSHALKEQALLELSSLPSTNAQQATIALQVLPIQLNAE